jgi:CMP/dCMP kinase
MEYIQIAIDGPAGAGKSSIAKEVAKTLQYIYIDTGAMYRAVTYIAMKEGIPFNQSHSVEKIAQDIDIHFDIDHGTQKIIVNNEDVSEEIRLPEVSRNVSVVSALSEVRREMVLKQREMGKGNHVVMDGRDIGTVVFPNAKYKIFLTANPEVRAARRKKEMEEKGHTVDFNQLLEEIKERDYMDENRADSPLVAAEDAIIIDTTALSFDEVLEKIITLIRSGNRVL